ncbi:HD domain protein [Streptomyces jeddahensis]|uniref:HD domain protein n=1 Tax=Streptomyces jeddahensis TaxID=1716141 RepID=A0A177HZU0_9ACTN|nr:HD domain protein [Streptomyces jeddahensis]
MERMKSTEDIELRSVEELMDVLYACRGAWDTPDRTGDPVDLHDHALQTAALLRRSHPSDKELQVAGLVHDIGYLLRPGDEAAHADHAAFAVRPLLGDRVARLVRLHVPAKRYLAATDPWHGLSPQSALTLELQGGAMTPAEARAFECDPMAEDAVTLRQADDSAKVAGLDAGVMEDWRPVLELVAAAQRFRPGGAGLPANSAALPRG